jgi:hypothetical protein
VSVVTYHNTLTGTPHKFPFFERLVSLFFVLEATANHDIARGYIKDESKSGSDPINNHSMIAFEVTAEAATIAQAVFDLEGLSFSALDITFDSLAMQIFTFPSSPNPWNRPFSCNTAR